MLKEERGKEARGYSTDGVEVKMSEQCRDKIVLINSFNSRIDYFEHELSQLVKIA